MTIRLLVILMAWASAALYAMGQEKMEGIHCPVMEKATAKSNKTTDYLGGKIYFCCDRCLATFQADPEKYATKANQQLVRTGQFKQVACPMSGKAVNELQTTEVNGISIAFCCGGCKARVDNEQDATAKAELVFASAPFTKAFAAVQDEINLEGVKCMFMVRRDVNPEKFTEFEGGKVFFCCDNCLKRFTAKPEDHATKAHHQLVRTGQVKQTACPISGHEFDADVVTEVAGVKVSFCCDGCLAKVTDAENDDARLELVFGVEGYKKGFSKKD